MLIELKSPESGTYYVWDRRDIIGVYTYTYNEKDYYSVILRDIRQWVTVNAETFFKVKGLMEASQ